MVKLTERLPNRKAKELYAKVRKHGIVSKPELLEDSGLTVSTLSRLLEEMTESGWLKEAGFGESTGGRRPVLYQTNPEAGYVFGLDISRAYSKLVLCDLHMNRLDTHAWTMTSSMTPVQLFQLVEAKVQELLVKHKLERRQVLGLGIGAVGPLDRNRGIILDPSSFPAKGWSDVKVCGLLEERLDMPVMLDNGANTAIQAEYWLDTPHEYQHLLYIRAGVGLRSSMMSNGKVVYGAVDMEGSVGHMIIQTDGIAHHERKHSYGCIESYVSIHALESQARSRLKQGRESMLSRLVEDPEQVEMQHLLQALNGGDPLVTELFTQAATCFGIGLANLLNILHPEKVILGGPLITSHPLFYDISTRIALKNTYYYPAYQVTFSTGKLGEDALAMGAAVMVANALYE